MEGGKNIRELFLLRRLQVALTPYVKGTDIIATDEKIVLRCRIDDRNVVTIPPDKMAKRLCRLLQALEPSVLGGKVKVEDLKLIIWALYAPIKALYPHRSRIREVTGLLRKEPKLMNYLIWKRIKATERMKQRGA